MWVWQKDGGSSINPFDLRSYFLFFYREEENRRGIWECGEEAQVWCVSGTSTFLLQHPPPQHSRNEHAQVSDRWLFIWLCSRHWTVSELVQCPGTFPEFLVLSSNHLWLLPWKVDETKSCCQLEQFPAANPRKTENLIFEYRHKTTGSFYDILVISLYRLNKFLQYLTEAGFRVSRTHFDPTGIRTDATLVQFKSVLTKYSVPTYTATATQTSVSTEKTVWENRTALDSLHTPQHVRGSRLLESRVFSLSLTPCLLNKLLTALVSKNYFTFVFTWTKCLDLKSNSCGCGFLLKLQTILQHRCMKFTKFLTLF